MDIQNLLTLLGTLYPSPTLPPNAFPSPETQDRAQKTLFDAIANVEAWRLAGSILDSVDTEPWGQDAQVRFFAAHMLSVKISRDWDTLSREHWLDLKSSLLRWGSQSARRAFPGNGSVSAMGEKIVLKKLSVAIAALSFRLVPENDMSLWPHWLIELMSIFAIEPKPTLEALLEVLIIIVEEYQRVDLTGTRRARYEQTLVDAGEVIVSTLITALEPGATVRVKSTALRACQAWLQTPHLPLTAANDLWPSLLRCMNDYSQGNEEVVSQAAQCVEELVSASGSGNSSSGFVTRARAESLLDWFSSAPFGELLNESIRQLDCSDTVTSLIKLFVTVCENSVSNLAATLTNPRTLELLSRLLQVTTFPGWYGVDETVSSFPLAVWTLLQEELADSGALGEEAEILGQSGAGEVAKNVFNTVANGLLTKSTWPSEHVMTPDQGWTKDAVKGFRQSRWDVGEALLSCYYVLREDILRRWITTMQEICSMTGQLDQRFEDLEALLYCIKVVQEAIPQEESVELPRLFSADVLGRLPAGDSGPLLRLRSTTLCIIGAYSEWFKDHPRELLAGLDYTIPYLSSMDSETVSLAANALRRLCDEGRRVLVDHISALAHVIHTTQGKLPSDEYAKVLESVTSVLQALPPDKQASPVTGLINPLIVQLDAAQSRFSLVKDVDNRTLLLDTLTLHKACATGLSRHQDAFSVVNDAETVAADGQNAYSLIHQSSIVDCRNRLMMVIASTLNCCQGDVEVSIALSDTIRHCTSSDLPTAMSLDSLSLFEMVSNIMIRDSINVATWLSLQTSLVVAIHRDRELQTSFDLSSQGGSDMMQPEEGERFKMSFQRSLRVAIEVTQCEQVLKQDPDVVQAFMYFCVSVTHRYVKVFDVLPEELEAITLTGIRALGSEDRTTLQAALGLLSLFVQQTREGQEGDVVFQQLIQRHGYTMLRRVLEGIGGALPRSSLPFLAELLHAFVIRLPHVTRPWLQQLLGETDFPSPKVTPARKATFVSKLCAARTLKKVRDLCTDFATVARGLEGTAYGGGALALSL